jgi:plastocyanin
VRIRPIFWVLLAVACLFSLTLAATVQIVVPAQKQRTQHLTPAIPTAIILMGPTNFVRSSITLEKGQWLTLIQDASDEHIITNGRWVNNTQQPTKASGAPTVDVLVAGAGSSATVGPFNTTGTFYLYCPLHPGMNLTVQVL